MVKREDVVSLATALGVPLVGGQIIGLLCMKDVKGWYARLKKPKWTPPNWLFGAVWPVLYVAQGTASWLVWRNKDEKRKLPLALYGAQLALNLAWQPIMFKGHRPDVATVESAAIVGLAAAATAFMTRAGGDHKGAVAGLMAPYLAWCTFATALSAKIWKDNPDASEIDDSPAGALPSAGVPQAPTTHRTAPAKGGEGGLFHALAKEVKRQ